MSAAKVLCRECGCELEAHSSWGCCGDVQIGGDCPCSLRPSDVARQKIEINQAKIIMPRSLRVEFKDGQECIVSATGFHYDIEEDLFETYIDRGYCQVENLKLFRFSHLRSWHWNDDL